MPAPDQSGLTEGAAFHARQNVIGDGAQQMVQQNPAAVEPTMLDAPGPHDDRYEVQPSGADAKPGIANWLTGMMSTMPAKVASKVRAAGLHLMDAGNDMVNRGEQGIDQFVASEKQGAQQYATEGVGARAKQVLGQLPAQGAAIAQGAYAATQPESFAAATGAQAIAKEITNKIDPEGKHPALDRIAQGLAGMAGGTAGGAMGASEAEAEGGAINPEAVKPGTKAAGKAEEAKSANTLGDTAEMAKSAWARAGGDKEEFVRNLYVDAHNQGREDIIQHLEGKMSPDEIQTMRQYTQRPPMTDEEVAQRTPPAPEQTAPQSDEEAAAQMRAEAGMAEPGPEAAAGGEGGGKKPPPPGAAGEGVGAGEGMAGNPKPNVGDHIQELQDQLNKIMDPKFRAEYMRQNQTVYDAFTKGGEMAKDPEFVAHMLNLNSGESANAEQSAGLMHMVAANRTASQAYAAQYVEARSQFGEGSPQEEEAWHNMIAHDAAYSATLGLRAEGFSSEQGRSLQFQQTDPMKEAMSHVRAEADRWKRFSKTGDRLGLAAAKLRNGAVNDAWAMGSLAKDNESQLTDNINYWFSRAMLSGGPAGPIRKVISTATWQVNRTVATKLAEIYENRFGGGSVPYGTARDMATAYTESLVDRIKLATRTMTGDTTAHTEVTKRLNDAKVFGREDMEHEIDPSNDPPSLIRRALHATFNVDRNSWEAVSDFDKGGMQDMEFARQTRMAARAARIGLEGKMTPDQLAKFEQDQVEAFRKAPTPEIVKATNQAMERGAYVNDPEGPFGKHLQEILNSSTRIPGTEYQIPAAKLLSQMWFFRTANNVMQRGLDMSPWGFARTLDAYNKAARNGMRDPEVSTKFFQAAIGTAAMALLWHSHNEGHVTMGGPNDPEHNREWQEAGNVPYTWRFPDWMNKLIDGGKDNAQYGFHFKYYEEMMPIISLVLDGKEVYEDARASGSPAADAFGAAVVNAFGRMAANLPFIGQLFRTLSVLQNCGKDNSLRPLAASYEQEGTPAILRTTGADKYIQQALEALHVMKHDAQTGYHKYNIYCEPLWAGPGYSSEESPGKWMSAANWILGNPLVKVGKVSPEYDEIMQLRQQIGWEPPKAAPYHRIGGVAATGGQMFRGSDPTKKGTTLTVDQEDELMKMVANKNGELSPGRVSLHDAVINAMKSKDYASASPTDRGEILSSVWRDYIGDAQDKLLQKHPDLQAAVDRNADQKDMAHDTRKIPAPVNFSGR